ncbi:sigma 54-interacting transcriptional regulator [Desulfallas sp. Bu1-1]|uniref:sigma-54 interaction domain-containing protein n=1 Tax=Desulfallas sp. Bu1-1 TaxID=2787620 RepID=UPI00189F388A|nr:sigma 54-interacting transcriptional regulator [Desulfallas sp. Bu1-1]MBF7082997.1 sigma 54-interacting transcriptional regulator [Desulfallas sp. Bu1-1]
MNATTIQQYRPKNEIFVGNSQFMKDLTKKVMQVAAYDCTVLLMGESGTGKELIANTIHKFSKRPGHMIKINCGAIPENLLESELFGYEHGAFTGAKTGGKPGKFEEADNGTLFLDEIGDMQLHLQVKLLRVLQEKEIIRVGGSKTKKINTRIIAATNKNLYNMVQEGKFREDLFYRLNVVPITIPPLRERREDIMPLLLHFKKKYEKKYNTKRRCSPEVIKLFLSYDWPGNVREMENLIERLIVTMEPKETITPKILIKDYLSIARQQLEKDVSVHRLMTLKEATDKVESQLINMAMSRYKTLKEIANALGVDQSTICRKLKQLNIQRI